MATSRADRARQVANVLRRQVAAGDFREGRLPDERALVAEFGASRNAVRSALAILRDEGLVDRKRGIGTVVVATGYTHPLDQLAGLAEALRGDVVNEIRAAGPVRAPSEVARRLALPAGSSVVYLERLRFLENVPLSLDSTYLAPPVGELVLALGRDVLAGSDVFGLIERVTGERLGHADVTVRATVPDPATRTVLGMTSGTATFTVERLTHRGDGRPVDLESVQLRGDRLTLSTTLDRDR